MISSTVMTRSSEKYTNPSCKRTVEPYQYGSNSADVLPEMSYSSSPQSHTSTLHSQVPSNKRYTESSPGFTFTHGGHYILVVSADDNEACILDPSYKEGKYEEPGRDGKARAVDGFVYCSLKVLAEDCANRTPSYYLFSRKH